MNEEKCPSTVMVRARDIKPYHYALWCRIQDGKPFANDIVGVRWNEDGTHLWFMLESHNFYMVGPDEMVEVVEVKDKRSEYLRAKYADWVLSDPPGKPTYEELEKRLASTESTLKLMRSSHEQTRAADAQVAEARIGALQREVERLEAERDRLIALRAAEGENVVRRDEHIAKVETERDELGNEAVDRLMLISDLRAVTLATCERAQEVEVELAKANALLREAHAWVWAVSDRDADTVRGLRVRIEAHLEER